MSFGENLVFLRKMRHQMSQEALAEQMGVSRQTVSKWEMNASYPEISKVIELCKFFSCSMDDLIQSEMNVCDPAFSNIRVEEVEAFRYVQYAVISPEPEEDAIGHVKHWAADHGVEQPSIIGWDFPHVSQEQVNVYHLHGYAAAWILPEEITLCPALQGEIRSQRKQSYVALTIQDPFAAPFERIPNAYKTLLSHIQVNQLSQGKPEGVIPCFEKEYTLEGTPMMDVYVGICP